MLEDDELRRTVDDLRKLFEVSEETDPGVRVYIESDRAPSLDLQTALPEYQCVIPHSTGSYELALLKKVNFESESAFRRECERLAAVIAPLLSGNSSVECCYDNALGATIFELHLRKGTQDARLAEYNPTA